MQCKKHCQCEKGYIWNTSTFISENGKCLTSIMHDSGITCAKIIESSNDRMNLNENNIYEKSQKNIFIYYIEYVIIKDSKYIKINSVNTLYLIFNKVNGYFERNNGNRYLALVHTNESKEKTKNVEKDQRFNQNNNFKLR